MNDWLLQLYYRLPYSFKVTAASAWGYYLGWWRYGPETDRLVEEALERETWTPEKWKGWQSERLAFVLHRAATKVPYYREQWSQRRRQGDRSSWEYLENWPILEKEPLRQYARAFVADDCHIRRMLHEHTSGSTGKPLDLWSSRQTVRAWYALVEARWRRWYGVSRHDRWAILGGQLITPVTHRKPPYWIWNSAFNQLYMSSYHLSPDLIPQYLEALSYYRIKYIYGYTSSLYALALEVLQSGQHKPEIFVAITNAEPIHDYQRQTISDAFQCPVRETYGMSEQVTAASECKADKLHMWPEVGIVEIMQDNQISKTIQSGDLICSGLLNTDMPLIRYRVGDRGTLPIYRKVCKCGCSLPMMSSIEGRVDDVLYTRDGRKIGRLDPVFKSRLPIREAQIIQENLNQVRLRVVPTPDFSSETGYLLIERLKERLGDVEITLEQMTEIPREAGGKFRAVVCNLNRNKIMS